MNSYSDLREEQLRWRYTGYDADADKELDDNYLARVAKSGVINAKITGLKRKIEYGGRIKPARTYHRASHRRIIRDYFGSAPVLDADGNVVIPKVAPRFNKHKFNRRFRMSRRQFELLYDDIRDPVIGHPFFQQKADCCGKKGASDMQKFVSVIRQLAYGTCSDHVHEYTGVADLTGRLCLRKFCDWMVKTYAGEWINTWGSEEIDLEMAANAKRGFPGMMGSIDCTHWEWKNCPVAWQGLYQDKTHKRTVIAEAICGHNMYFYQVYVGLPGSLNDLNVMERTTMQSNYRDSGAIDKKFTVMGEEFTGAYFLADAIYPDNSYMVKSLQAPRTEKEKYFAEQQEAKRKDVERSFARLLSKWHILAGSARTWDIEYLKKIWLTCFILHNMTLKDQEFAKSEEKVKKAAAVHINIKSHS